MGWQEWASNERQVGDPMDEVFMGKWHDRIRENGTRPVELWHRSLDYGTDVVGWWYTIPDVGDIFRGTPFLPLFVPPWASQLVIRQIVDPNTNGVPPFTYEVRLRVGSTYSDTLVVDTDAIPVARLHTFRWIPPSNYLGTVQTYWWEVRGLTSSMTRIELSGAAFAGDGIANLTAWWERL